MYFGIQYLSDNAPLCNVIALTEIINGIIGWGFLIYYWVKYKRLNDLNVNRKEVIQDDVTAMANDEVRQSVMI